MNVMNVLMFAWMTAPVQPDAERLQGGRIVVARKLVY
jgi:hypothetical protein